MTKFVHMSDHFHKGVRYNLCGSILYETIKTIHNFFLLSVMAQHGYGLIASTISLMYFASKLADAGASSSLSLLFSHLTRSRSWFWSIMKSQYIYYHLPLMIIIASLFTILYKTKLSTHTPYLWILILCIIVGESIRYFLRILLHAAFKSKVVVMSEVTLYVFFTAMVWMPFLVYGRPIDLYSFLIAHLIDSWLCVGIFIGCTYSLYRKLPPQAEFIPMPSPLRIWYTKCINFFARMSRDFFASNFLTPLFAYKCGLEAAGAFYFASVVVGALHSTIKMSIHYPANGLLWNLQDSDMVTKKAAFHLLFQKLIALLIPFVFFITLNHSFLLHIGSSHHLTVTTMAIMAVLIVIALFDVLLLLYEQFYIAEQSTHRFLSLKLLECILLYFFVIKSPHATVFHLIATTAIIKALSFVITALNGFTRWRIKPVCTISPWWFLGTSFISFLWYLATHLS